MSQLPQWLKKLRDIEITQRVNIDPRSQPGMIFGYDGNTATRDVAGWGQADFDTRWQDLSPDDRVLMYAHFFQFGHLQELIEAFQMLFAKPPPPEAPIVVDLGCGPFTGGLAFASALGAAPKFDYIGVDRSQAMRKLGERLASAAQRHNKRLRIDRHWSSAISSVSWPSEIPSFCDIDPMGRTSFAGPALAHERVGKVSALWVSILTICVYMKSRRHQENDCSRGTIS